MLKLFLALLIIAAPLFATATILEKAQAKALMAVTVLSIKKKDVYSVSVYHDNTPSQKELAETYKKLILEEFHRAGKNSDVQLLSYDDRKQGKGDSAKLFLPSQFLPEAIEEVKKKGVVTFGTSLVSLNEGAMFTAVATPRLTIHINRQAVEKSKIKLSSSLLSFSVVH